MRQWIKGSECHDFQSFADKGSLKTAQTQKRRSNTQYRANLGFRVFVIEGMMDF
jgi:hypothetical protein